MESLINFADLLTTKNFSINWQEMSLPWRNSLLFTISVLFFLTLFASWKSLPINIPGYQVTMDRVYYLKIAEGNEKEVIKPFIKRFLHPKTAAFLSKKFSIDIGTSFFIISLVSLASFLFFITTILKNNTSIPIIFSVVLIFSPYLSLLFYDYYMHDLFYVMMTCLFFFFLSRNLTWPALITLFPLFLIREATILLCLLFLVLCLIRKKYIHVLGMMAITFVAMKVSSHFAHLGGPNRHEMGELPFMISKVIYNFLANFLGINMWVTGYEHCVPSSKWAVPSWFAAGHITEFGICNFQILQPIHTLYRYLTIFGLIPYLVIKIIIHHWKKIFQKGEFWLVLALGYGLLSFLIGPSLGPGGWRLMGQGWSAFWLAGPIIISRYLPLNPHIMTRLFVIHVLIVWIPWLVEIFNWKAQISYPIIITATAILYALALKTLPSVNKA